MKKLKEFLLLFVPLLTFIALPVILFVTKRTENAFMSNAHYFKLLVNDAIFVKVIFNIYCRAIAFSFVAVACVALLCHVVKYIRSRMIFYPAAVIAASTVALFDICKDKVAYFGLPMGVYDPQYLLTNSPPPISVSASDIFLALQIGFLTTFLFWLLELLIVWIKTQRDHKRKVEL